MDLFSIFKGGKYFDKHMAPKCDYCQFGRRAKDGNKVLCEKRGLVDCNYSCNKFIYSPLKRIPVKQLNFVGSLADEDIYIESAGDIAEKKELENPQKKDAPKKEKKPIAPVIIRREVTRIVNEEEKKPKEVNRAVRDDLGVVQRRTDTSMNIKYRTPPRKDVIKYKDEYGKEYINRYCIFEDLSDCKQFSLIIDGTRYEINKGLVRIDLSKGVHKVEFVCDFYVTSECHDITDAVIKNSEKDATCIFKRWL